MPSPCVFQERHVSKVAKTRSEEGMQQPAPTLEKISDLIACAVCLEVVKNPRLLPCQHSFCLACLSQISKNESISCPLCRINHDIPDAAKLPVDFMKNSLLEIVEQEKRAGPIRPKIWYCTSCDESEHEEAVGYCEECKEYLCMDHQKVHAKDKNTKTHQITPVEKVRMFKCFLIFSLAYQFW